MTTKSILGVFLIGFALVLSACDKEAPGPSAADLNRCSHIDRDAELGEYLYDVCLRNPWPTDLPPATQSGQSSFGGIINDTLIFVAGSPKSFSYETANAKVITLTGGTELPYRTLYAGMGTWTEIDSSLLLLSLAILPSSIVPSGINMNRNHLQISFHDKTVNGYYILDTNRYEVELLRWDDDVVAGTIDAWFVDQNDSAREIHLSEGRFDLTVRPQ